ncbi:zinc-dependent metalloprotease [Bdellovibrio bacteriovorus]|uniref:zinc-dependent metalloprotease n=1 Tax=Bdellovibrio bacteriovorus TaxID=959 RepID=UPI0021D07684|nr:zinc-dependent metalloprotease [Bdellovibrio bacteriovorus]UXR64490.1 zinc-dependent metalloprotease [Bdellovibrio bacteriovorus]
MTHKPQYTKAFTALLTFALVAAGCTAKRDAALPDAEALQTFAISEFGNISEGDGYKVSLKPGLRAQNMGIQSNKATQEKGLVAIDAEESGVPKRLRFMFKDLEVSGQEQQSFKIVFGVDSKYVTAYKMTSDLNSLTVLEQSLAVSPAEVKLSIELQKAKNTKDKKAVFEKMAVAQKSRTLSLRNRSAVNVMVPLFKYDIARKGILERVKNSLREETSTLNLRETEFSQATHISIDTTSDGRKDVGSVDQKKELDQLFTTESLDGKVFKASELQERFKFNMKFVADDAQVLAKLDSDDMKVYEMTTLGQLSEDEQRLVKSGNTNGELISCGANSGDKTCIMRLVATVPVTYKNARLNLADSKENTSNSLELEKVTKAKSQGLVEISRDVRAERARPTGIIDPLNTIRVSDLKGEFYFRRTFEDASNMLLVAKSGTSGDMTIVKFEMEKDRLVVRNQKALIDYIGQGARDREELMSVPVKYFKLEKVDADGVALQVPKLIDAKKEDAEYIEIDWTRNTIPVANSPLAYFTAGQCWAAQAAQSVTDMDMRLANDGVLNFSLAGSYSVIPDCANTKQVNDAYFSYNTQFNYNVVERLSFKKRTNAAVEDKQFAPNISPTEQNAMNFAIFTLADNITDPNVRQGRVDSQVYRPVIHDFRNGKVLNYWIGGLDNASAERKALIEQAATEVVAEWNEAFHKALKGTSLQRSGAYIVLNKETEGRKSHIGDLDRNYLWFFDLPTENGLLGVAQPAPNPHSGTIIANNVIVYSGNSERNVKGILDITKEQREYEEMLEEAKQEALAEFQQKMAEEKAAPAASKPQASANASPEQKVEAMFKAHGSFMQRLALSARPVKAQRATSKYTSALANKKSLTGLRNKNFKKRKVVSDVKVTSSKDFTRRVIEEALSGEFRNDPMMLEAIVAKELARTEQGLSPQIKALLQQQAQLKHMSAKFDVASKKRGGCFMYARNDYNDAFTGTDFNELFKKEIKATLLHEIGHSLGLVHNFKASFDRKNFKFEGEETKRNYTSIMDYIAPSEMEYAGPGTYDVHALRAIYGGIVELSAAAMKGVQNNSLTNPDAKTTIPVVNNKFISLGDVQKFFGLKYSTDVVKSMIEQTGLLRHYGQCHDGEVGSTAACTPYDEGSSAVDIVKAQVQNYNRLYSTHYHAADRINFGWSQKVSVISRNIGTFSTIRSFLDQAFMMQFYGTALNDAEAQDFMDAAHIAYDFFHEVLRIPDTNLPFGKDKEEIKKRLIPIQYTMQKPVTKENANDGLPVKTDANGQQFKEVNDVRVLEARRVYDYGYGITADRFDTLGIGFDKQFALQFLMTANPAALTDDSQMGWISFNEFEQYMLGVNSAAESTNMITLYEIMNGSLNAGFIDEDHNLIQVNAPATINRNLLDSAVLSGLADTNIYRSFGLDTYAEFFKVGILKGGKSISDRATVARFGQSSKSAAGIKFYGADNALGANLMVSTAARKAILLENQDDLSQKMVKMLNLDTQLGMKINAAKAKPELKDKSAADIIAADKELQTIQAAANAAAAELTAAMNELNKNGEVVTKEEISQNPNLAIEVQVQMLRSMLNKSMTLLITAKPYLEQVPLEQLQPLLDLLAKEKSTNSQLATLDLLALGQEVLTQATANIAINLNGRGQVPGSAVIGLMMERTPLTSAQQSLMYVIEDLARYTSILNPEYTH